MIQGGGNIKFDNSIPIYLQIIEKIRTDIAKGVYKPGEKIESVRELALNLGVNPNTVQRALVKLEEQGLMYTERTTGKFITKDENHLEALKKEIPTRITKNYIEEMRETETTDEQIINFVKENL
ncbi:MAG: GntR family transcriptional regulator [Defluviitaleaceae bacterium]|nr:GntR family transcriptional regulator [Defluviitaleaceae bacterium]